MNIDTNNHMRPQRLPNYLRRHRKRLGLSQEEVAFLLGNKSGTKVSRYERFTREPTLRTALACEAIFHTPIKDLFAGLAEEVERAIERRARTLARRLTTQTNDGNGGKIKHNSNAV